MAKRPCSAASTYIATALAAPGVIEQTGTHRRIVFGEVFGALPRMSDRVRRDPRGARRRGHPVAEAVEDGRVPIWEKFIFLVALAGFTGATRLPIGPLWADPVIRERSSSTAAAKSSGSRAPRACRWRADVVERISSYVAGIPGTMRSSLLIDLSQGKRIEVEALQGSVVRRAARAGRAGADYCRRCMRC